MPIQDLLFLSYYFPPDTAVGGARTARFVRHAGEFGWNAYVIAEGRGKSEAAVIRTPGQAPAGGPSFWSRAARSVERLLPYNERLPWVPHAVAEASRLIQSVRIEAVVSTSPPLATHFAAWWLKKRFGVRWVADFRDPLAGNPCRTRALGRLYDPFVEARIMASADAVIANTDTVQKLWRQRYPKHAHKIHLIWNGFDADRPVETGPPAEAHSTRVLLHAGTIYGPRHPGALVASMDRLITSGRLDPSTVRFVQLGSVEKHTFSYHPEAVERLTGLGCLECMGHVSTADARQREKSADYFFVLDYHDRDTGLQVPAKLYELIRLGRPILALTPAGSPVDRILKQSGIPHCCFDTVDPPAEVDRKLQDFFKRRPTQPVAPSAWFLDSFNAKAQTAQLCSIIRGLGQPEPGQAAQAVRV